MRWSPTVVPFVGRLPALLVYRLDPVTVRVEHEGCVVRRAVLGPRSRCSGGASSGLERPGVEAVHCRTIWRLQSQVKTGVAGDDGLTVAKLDRQPVVSAGDSISERSIRSPDTDVAERF